MRRAPLPALLLAAIGSSACPTGEQRRPILPDAPAATSLQPDAAPPRTAAPEPPPVDEPAPPRGTHIVLLHSADLLGEYEAHPLGGLARRATLARRLEQQADTVLQVDAGNLLLSRRAALPVPEGMLAADPKELERRAKLLLAGLARAGLDAFTPGITDLAVGPKRLRELARSARIAVLAANLVDQGGKRWFEADRLVEAAGLKVGIFGVVGLPTAEESARWESAGVVATDPTTAARMTVASLRERGAVLIVALLHMPSGRGEARRLIELVPGIDFAVLGGGSEDGRSKRPSLVGRTPLLETTSRGRKLGRVDLHVLDRSLTFADRTQGEPVFRGGKPVSWRTTTHEPLGSATESDPAVVAMVKRYIDETRRRAERDLPVGILPRPAPLPPGERPALEDWTYGSNGACDLCHKPATAQWQETAHAFALETLRRKGRDKDPDCLRCHTTGFERPGGTRSLKTATTYFANVGCESCHGPSVAHVRAQNKTGTNRAVPAKVCVECHTPDQSDVPFDYQSALKWVIGPGHGGGS